MSEPGPVPLRRFTVVVGVVALVWRVAVFAAQLRGLQPAGVATWLGVLGLAFLACGLLALRFRTDLAHLLALFCFCQAIHWGGSLELSGTAARSTLLLGYLVVSMLGISALLHFALRFPPGWRRIGEWQVRAALYGPVGLAALLTLAWSVAPGARDALQGPFLLLHAVQSNLYPALALLLMLGRWRSATGAERQARGLGVLCAAWVLAILPWLVASGLGPEIAGDSQPYAVFFVLEPIGALYALGQLRSGASR